MPLDQLLAQLADRTAPPFAQIVEYRRCILPTTQLAVGRRNEHRAAKILVAQHDGKFPRDPADVRRLPGIGRYTAGAILSIAFGDRQPILEANTTRLFSRLLAYRGDPVAAEGQRLLWAMAAVAPITVPTTTSESQWTRRNVRLRAITTPYATAT